ncbi:chemotaxis protein [Pseudomonas fulva]|uniref:methyl-accepting chemotaxis protein n=1 Tax=Pseudomonas fulva TaxID=47880 RepID=UPI000CE953C9|nr:methyl-accepting chemotaxis protein [Pseudomonas fulva]AVF54873.1 chemotaxis protein [Pseudomonas fulva]
MIVATIRRITLPFQNNKHRGQNQMLHNLAIKTKITLASLTIILTVIILITSIGISKNSENNEQTYRNSNQIITKNIQQVLESKSAEQTEKIRGTFNSQINLVEFLAHQTSSMHDLINIGADSRRIRQQQNALLKELFEAHPGILGLWIIMYPNQLGEDSSFINSLAAGSNEAGRFSSYWVRPEGRSVNIATKEESVINSSVGDSGFPANYYMTCPEKNRSTCVLEPFYGSDSGTRILMTSISTPIMVDGKVIGVAGIDVSLSSLQTIAEEAKRQLYDGKGDLLITTGGGLMAANSADAATVGKKTQTLSRPNLSAPSSGQPESLRFIKDLKLSSNAAWKISVELPSEVASADSLALKKAQSDLLRDSTVFSTLIAVIAALLGAVAMWFIAAGLTKPMSGVAAMLKDIAEGEGDLTKRLHYTSKNELGDLVRWFNLFLDKLQPTIQKIRSATVETRSTASRSNQIAKKTSMGMQSQLREIEQVATASHEMSATAHEVAASAARAANAAQGADESAKNGLQAIARSTEDITDLVENLSAAMSEARSLSDKSEEIGSVLEVIRSIAQQTNLLALNAAIEAARAGESGRGFAVVADEVRNLAMRTQESIEQIREVIERLQSGTEGVVNSMQSSYSKAEVSQETIQATALSFRTISDAVSVISEMNLQIAAAAEEQSAVAEDVNRNITNIRQVTDELSVSATETAAISEHLSSQADLQLSLAEQFKS